MCLQDEVIGKAGAIYCKVNSDRIEMANVDSQVSRDDIYKMGAQSVFVGKVRSRNFGRTVVAVLYDAMPELAESELCVICKEAQVKWGSDLILVVQHRTGELKVGEVSVAISVHSKHRDESYQASRYVIEEIKKRVPIWKKEIYDDGETEWLKGHALCESHSHGE